MNFLAVSRDGSRFYIPQAVEPESVQPGSALSCPQTLPPGVYIAMNGQHFEWDHVRKNRQTGGFEPA